MKSLSYLIAMSLISVVLLCSCGSRRATMRHESTIATVISQHRKDSTSATEQMEQMEMEDLTEETEVVTTIYDTNRPVDSTTGKPPVLSETKKRTKREHNKNTREHFAKSQNQSYAEQLRDTTSIIDKRDEVHQQMETTVPNQIKGVFWALIVLVGLIILGWLAINKSKKC